MLGVEDGVDGGEADVLVGPTVAGDVVRVKQLVIVDARSWWCIVRIDDGVGIGGEQMTIDGIEGVGRRGNVDQELVTSTQGMREVERGCGVALDEGRAVVGGAKNPINARGLHHNLRKTVCTFDEVAVGVSRQQWNVAHVRIGQIDAEEVAGLCLDGSPGGHAAAVGVVGGAKLAVATQIVIGDQFAGRMRLAVRAHRVLAQEHLVRGARGIGLVLIDERRGGVLLFMDVVGSAKDAVGAGQHGGPGLDHEIGAVVRGIGNAIRPRVEERIIRLQRNEDEAVATLGDEVETVIEELAEEGEPGIERRRQPEIGRLVFEEKHLGVIGGAKGLVQAWAGNDLHTFLQHVIGGVENAVGTGIIGRGVGGWIVDGLIDNQIADRAWVGVKDKAAGLRIGGRIADGLSSGAIRVEGYGIRRLERRGAKPRKGIIGGPEFALRRHQVVERTVDGAQPEGQGDVRH